jgi:Aminopeptidase N
MARYLVGRDFAFPEYVPRFPRQYDFDVVKLDLDVELDIWSREVRGVARYRVRAKRDLRRLALDAAELEVLGASTGYSYDGESISLDLNLPAGREAEFEVRYRARPRKGIYFVLPDRHHPYRVPMAWTQGESEDNRYWIPLPDTPNIKFPWRLSITVPKPYVAGRQRRIGGGEGRRRQADVRLGDEAPHVALSDSARRRRLRDSSGQMRRR